MEAVSIEIYNVIIPTEVFLSNVIKLKNKAQREKWNLYVIKFSYHDTFTVHGNDIMTSKQQLWL